jgi:sugar lactone lactonase YvrE
MRLSLLAIAALATASCAHHTPGSSQGSTPSTALERVASSPRQWTGIAVSQKGRIFVNFPRWSEDVPVSVAELKNGEAVPFPNATWNTWTPETSDPQRFVAVQSVVIDDQDRLWVLDTGNPWFKGVITPPRLHQFDLARGELVRSYTFAPEVSSGDSYLNDVTFDTRRNVAYLTDSQAGGLVVLNLESGNARKVLAQHPSTHAEAEPLTVMGRTMKKRIQSDGIALSPDRETLYWAALTGHVLWRIPTAALLDRDLDDEALAQRIERVNTIVATDGIMFDRHGTLWLGGLEDNSIHRYVPGGAYEQVIQDARLRWPDSFAQGPEGKIYVTTSQIHLPPAERGPYEIYRFTP